MKYGVFEFWTAIQWTFESILYSWRVSEFKVTRRSVMSTMAGNPTHANSNRKMYFSVISFYTHVKRVCSSVAVELRKNFRDKTVVKGPAKRYIVADTNISPFARARNTDLLPTQKVFLILFRSILCLHQMFPSLRSMETQHPFCAPRLRAQEWATMCPQHMSSFARALKCIWYEILY